MGHRSTLSAHSPCRMAETAATEARVHDVSGTNPFCLRRWRQPTVRLVEGAKHTMTSSGASSAAVALIAAMVTPALLILACASLVATALLRMARVVDRARALVATAHDGNWERIGATAAQLRTSLYRHGTRARYAEWSITALYASVVIFVLTCLSIVVDHGTSGSLNWLPAALAVTGTLPLLAGGAWMVAKSRLGGEQIAEEIHSALTRLEERP